MAKANPWSKRWSKYYINLYPHEKLQLIAKAKELGLYSLSDLARIALGLSPIATIAATMPKRSPRGPYNIKTKSEIATE